MQWPFAVIGAAVIQGGGVEAMHFKPKLIPVQVPWMISPSAPYLALQLSPQGTPVSATFIGYFKLDDDPSQTWGGESVEIVDDPGSFVSATKEERGPFRFVRVWFRGAVEGRTHPAFSESEIIEEGAYDRSAIVGRRRPGETPEQNIARCAEYWLETGMSPSPRMYEVIGKPWSAEMPASSDLHHYMLLGSNIYVEIIAKDWGWEAGRVVA